MTRETFKDKAMYLLSGERFLGLPLFEAEDIEDYRISDEQGDMPFDDFLDRLYTLGVAEGWIPDIVNCSELPTSSTTKNDLSSELEKNSKKLEKNFGELDCISRQKEEFEWCDTCKEYDQEKHCCHRWSKVIRNTVDEMKQEYIEREVLDKIRAELHATAELHDDGDYYLHEGWIGEIFDKYKAENNS